MTTDRKAKLLDKDLADAVKNLSYRYRAGCNDCNVSLEFSNEVDALDVYDLHEGHDNWITRSL